MKHHDQSPGSWNFAEGEDDKKEEPKPRISLPSLFQEQRGPDFFGQQIRQAEENAKNDKKEDDKSSSKTSKKSFRAPINPVLSGSIGVAGRESSAPSAGDAGVEEPLSEPQANNEAEKNIDQVVQDTNETSQVSESEPLSDETEPVSLGEAPEESGQEIAGAENKTTEEDDPVTSASSVSSSVVGGRKMGSRSSSTASAKSPTSSTRSVPPPIPPPFIANNPNTLPLNTPNNPNAGPNVSPIINPNAAPGNTTRIIERRSAGALLAFLGAEYLSRRRDRRLSGEIKRQEVKARQRMDEIRDNQMSQTQAQNRLAEHQKRQVELLEKRQKNTEDQLLQERKKNAQQAESLENVMTEKVVVREVVSPTKQNQERPVELRAASQDLDPIVAERGIETNIIAAPVALGTELQKKYGEQVRQSISYENSQDLSAEYREQQTMQYETFEREQSKKKVKSRKDLGGFEAGFGALSQSSTESSSLPPFSFEQKTDVSRQSNNSSDAAYKKAVQIGAASAMFILVLVVIAYAVSR